jgi:hypothetical protein
VTEAVATVDETRLLYATKDEISSRDLKSGAVKSLVKGESVCLALGARRKSLQLSTAIRRRYEILRERSRRKNQTNSG